MALLIREHDLHTATYMNRTWIGPHLVGGWALALALLLVRAPGVQAQSPTDLMLDDGGELPGPVEKVVVLSDLRPHATVVISGQELRNRGYHSLGDALAFVVGVHLRHNTLGRVFSQRGITDGLALVIDGVPQVELGGSTALDVDSLLNLEDVDRVEVVRGPATAVSGVGALSGVVRIFTRKPGLTGVAARVGVNHIAEREVVGTGTYRVGDLAALATVGARQGPAMTWRLDGVPTRYIQVGRSQLFGTKERKHVTPTDDTEVIGRAAASYGDFLVDGWFSHTQQHSPLSAFTHALVEDKPQLKWQGRQRLRLLWSRHVGPVHVEAAMYFAFQKLWLRIPLYPVSPVFPYGGVAKVDRDSTTTGAMIRMDVPLGRAHRLVLGTFGDVTRDDARSHVVHPVTGERKDNVVRWNSTAGTLNTAVEYQGDYGWGLHVTAGAVVQWRTGFHGALAPRAALTWVPLPWLSARLAYGEGIRTPQRYELIPLTQAAIDNRILGTSPNRGLLPERVRSVEAGLTFDPSSLLHVAADLYAARHEDAIDNAIDGTRWRAVNLRPRVLAGGEMVGSVDLLPGWLNLWANTSITRNVEGPALEPDAWQVALGGQVTPAAGLEMGARARLRYAWDGPSPEKPSRVVDVFASWWPAGERFGLMAGIRNAFDEDEQFQDWDVLPSAAKVAVPSPGRTVYVALEGRW